MPGQTAVQRSMWSSTLVGRASMRGVENEGPSRFQYPSSYESFQRSVTSTGPGRDSKTAQKQKYPLLSSAEYLRVLGRRHSPNECEWTWTSGNSGSKRACPSE